MYGDVEPFGQGFKYTGGFLQCPECEADARLKHWGEGVDCELECTECDAKDSIR